jgi:uncharacterized membrane protein YdjX (TVP38/TMEM64 family)
MVGTSKSIDEACSQLMKIRPLINTALLSLLILLTVIALYYREQSLVQIKSTLQGLDMATAAIILVGASTIAALVLFPVSLLMLFSGAYFGLWWGFIFNTIGFMTGAMLAFLTARHLARSTVTALLPTSAHRALARLETSGWQTVAVLRTVSIIPGVLVNYALGITALPLATYAWASLVFTLPNIFIITYAGVAGEDFVRNGELGKLLLAVSLLAIAALAAALLRKRFAK